MPAAIPSNSIPAQISPPPTAPAAAAAPTPPATAAPAGLDQVSLTSGAKDVAPTGNVPDLAQSFGNNPAQADKAKQAQEAVKQQQIQMIQQQLALLQRQLAQAQQKLQAAQQDPNQQAQVPAWQGAIQNLQQKIQQLQQQLQQLQGGQTNPANPTNPAAPAAGANDPAGGANPAAGGASPGGGSAGGGSPAGSAGGAPAAGGAEGNPTASAIPSPQLTANDQKLAQAIEQQLQGTPLGGQGMGAHFVAAGRQNDVDPLALVAISKLETGFGKLGVGIRKHMGVGAYDNNPNGKTPFDGAVQQIYSGAKTFARLRAKGGSNSKAPMAQQLAAVNRAGWATAKNWHTGVGNAYNQIVNKANASVGQAA